MKNNYSNTPTTSNIKYGIKLIGQSQIKTKLFYFLSNFDL